jgi:hypothetical protein
MRYEKESLVELYTKDIFFAVINGKEARASDASDTVCCVVSLSLRIKHTFNLVNAIVKLLRRSKKGKSKCRRKKRVKSLRST